MNVKSLKPISLILFLLGASLLCSKQSYAAGDDAATQEKVTKIRLWGLFTSLGFDPIAGNGYAGFAGLSSAFEYKNHWEIEFGGGINFSWASITPLDVFARAGYSLDFVDDRNEQGQGWVWHFDALAGFRVLKLTSQLDGIDASEVNLCLHAMAGVDAAYWFNNDFGIDFRLWSGVNLPFIQAHNRDWGTYPHDNEDSVLIVDLNISLGIAF